MANRERSNSFNTIKYFILNATTYLTNTDNDFRRNIINYGLKRASKFNWEIMCDKIVAVYKNII